MGITGALPHTLDEALEALPKSGGPIPADLARYSAMLGVVPELESHRKALALPQWFADRVDWELYVHAVEDAWDELKLYR